MKTIKSLTICALCAMLVVACGKKQEQLPGITASDVDSVSYAVGISFGAMLEQSEFQNLNFKEINKGMHDYLDKKELKINKDNAVQVIQSYMMKYMDAKAKAEEEKEKAFFEKNKTAEGVQVSPKGVQYKIVTPGNDVKPSPEDTVEVKYVGKLLDGTEFDSNMNAEPIKFPLNGVIPGWSEGMQYIGEGGKIILWIPFNLGYGSRPAGEKIPACSTLNFEVQLIKVYRAKAQEPTVPVAEIKK